VDFSGDPRFDNPREVQVRLLPFDLDRLLEVGRRVRDIYPAETPERVAARVNDEVIRDLARGITGELGGKVGVAPRLFLRKLVSDLLDKVDEFPDYDPRQHFKLVVSASEMTAEERAAGGHEQSVDDIVLDLAGRRAKDGDE
jgi:hypothetical protein